MVEADRPYIYGFAFPAALASKAPPDRPTSIAHSIHTELRVVVLSVTPAHMGAGRLLYDYDLDYCLGPSSLATANPRRDYGVQE